MPKFCVINFHGMVLYAPIASLRHFAKIIDKIWVQSLSHRNTNFTIERGRALFVEWTVLVSIISPESFIISPRADYETHNQP